MLQSQKTKRLWITLDHLVGRYDNFNEEFKNRNNQTAKALGEVFSYIESIKNDLESLQNSKNNETVGESKSLKSGFNHSANNMMLEFKHLNQEITKLKSQVSDIAINNKQQFTHGISTIDTGKNDEIIKKNAEKIEELQDEINIQKRNGIKSVSEPKFQKHDDEKQDNDKKR